MLFNLFFFFIYLYILVTYVFYYSQVPQRLNKYALLIPISEQPKNIV